MPSNAQKARLYVSGVRLSGKARGFAFNDVVDMLDSTTLEDTAYMYMPGQTGSTVSIDLLLDTDTTAGGQWDTLTAWKSTQGTPITLLPSGLAVLSEAFMVNGLLGQLQLQTAHDDLVTADLQSTTTGAFDPGFVLENDTTAITVDGNGTARDLTAASTNGGVAHLHVTAMSGLSADDITIEQSANGSSGWSTVVTFAQVTGRGAQRVEITGSVNRYLRVVDNVTGTGSISRFVSFARR